METRAALAAGDLNRTLVLLNDSVGHCQTQTGSFAATLGSEEGVVNALDVLGGDAMASVRNIYTGTGFLAPCPDRKHTTPLHGIPRIEEQIQEDLLQFAGVAMHRRQAGGQIQTHL